MATRKVILEGELGDRLGREWDLHCSTPSAALALIRCNREEFVPYLLECHREGIDFVVTIGGQDVTADRCLAPFAASEPLVIMPRYMAAGDGSKGLLSVVGGIALIALSAFTFGASAGAGILGTGIGAGGTAGFVANLGVAMVLGGAASLIAGQPEFGELQERDNENKASYLFDGPTNRVRQGNARPLIYGAVIMGGQPISMGINNEEWTDPGEADQGTVTGSGYSDANSGERATDTSAFSTSSTYGGWTGSGGGGGGKGGGAQKQAVEAPDSYRSISLARVQYLLGEGELYGPLDSNWNLIDTANRLGSALFLDETQVQNDEDGTFNFKRITAFFQPGTPGQKHIPGFDTTESEVSVGTEVVNATPIVSTITTTTVDAVRVTIRLPQMYTRNLSNGNVDGASVRFRIELNYDSGGYVEVLDRTIRQKNMNPTLHSYRFDLVSFTTDCKVRVTRVSADNPESHIQNRIFFHARTDIEDEKLNHPNTAKLALDIDATQFSRIPASAIRLGGLKVQIPDNYDPIQKDYSGAWGGGFDVEWTNNPAWVFLDLITANRYGLGRWVSVTQNDTAALYTISQACDELVTQGISRSVTLVAAFTSSATSILISVPDAWIADGDTIEFPTTTVTVDGKIRRGAIDAPLTTGTLTVGAQYRITSVAGSADFTNVGAAANAINTVFTATGTTPTAWGTGSLQPLYKTITVDATPGAEAAAGVTGVYTGKEPRFECNLVIESQQDAYQAIVDLASVFRGMAYWGSGLFKAVQDISKTPVLQFTNANIVGTFKYSGTAVKSRHTTAQVRYNEPDDFFRARVIYVEDSPGVFRYGVREKRLVAFGCSSESQAMRFGRFVLLSERLETKGVEFTCGLEAHALEVGDVFATYDNRLSTAVLSGRTRNVTTTTAVLDREVTLESGNSYQITFVKADGSGLVTKAISTPAGSVTEVTFSALLTAELPTETGVFMIQDTSTATRTLWRALSIAEKEKGQFSIIGLQYDADKFAAIEAIEREGQRPEVDTLRLVRPVTGLDVITERVSTDIGDERFATATWNASTDTNVRSYVLTSRRDDGDWEPAQETFATTLRVPLGAPGVYEIQVVATNSIGVKSGPVSTTFTLTDNGLVAGITDQPTIDPRGGIKPDGVDLDDVRFYNEEGESEVRYTITEEEQITTGAPTSGQEWLILDATASGEVLTTGATTNLREYRIWNNGGGLADFTNCGAPDNNVGTIFTANGNTPTSYGTGGELQESTNSDFTPSGAADNDIGTQFTANGTAPHYGTDGELRKVTDTDPLTTSETVSIYNPNWLLQSTRVITSAWTKVDGTVTEESIVKDPDGGVKADQVEPSGGGGSARIELYQDVTIPNLYKGQYWTFSIWERVSTGAVNFTGLTIEIEERGGAAAASSTTLKFAPTIGAWNLRQVTHQVQQTDRTTLRVKVSAENADNPDERFLFCAFYQLEMGRARTKYFENTTTAGGSITVPSVSGTQSVRARVFITDDIYSNMVEESYDFDDGATKVAEPDVRPFGSNKLDGTEFPLTVTIQELEPSATVKYTTDGSDPAAGTTYSAPFEVASGEQVRAIATKASFTDSEERVEEYEQGF